MLFLLLYLIIQASFKASEQCIRTYCLGPLSTVQLSIDILFLKQLLPCFLKESNEDVESIADQVMQAVNESNACDEQYTAQDAHIAIPKAVADGVYTAGKTAVILKK